jgi:hypothetical protein
MGFGGNTEANGLGVVIAFSGSIEADELHGVWRQLHTHESYSRLRYQIWDFSGAERMNITGEDLRQLAMVSGIPVHGSHSQRVALIPRQNVHSGLDELFHIYEQIWGTHETKTLHDVDAAREWGRERVEDRHACVGS